MKSLLIISSIVLLLDSSIHSQAGWYQQNSGTIQNNLSYFNYYYQSNNINTIFSSDGVFNYDRPGNNESFIWPVSATHRMTLTATSGIWIGTKLLMPNNLHEFRFSGASWGGQFSAGYIPVPGQVPPQSVCNDTTWKGYLVSLTDSTLINGGIRIKTAGGNQFSFRYSSWYSWPVFAGAPYVEINNIPGYQPGWTSDRPGIGNSFARPDELLLMIMMDYTNCSDSIRPMNFNSPGGTRPIGVEIHQLVFMFDHPALNNAYFAKWKLINKSARVMDSTYFGIFVDADLGYGFDDAKGSDSIRQVGFNYNGKSSDLMYGNTPPALGFEFLQTPVIKTNNNNDTAKIYCDTIIGSKQVNLTTYADIRKYGDSCLLEPYSSEFAYNFMKGLDGCGHQFVNYVTGNPTKFKYSGDACNRTGWFDSTIYGYDTRALISSGPFSMQPLDTQIIIASFFVALGTSNYNSVCRVLQYADDIRALYGYLVCGYPIIGISNFGHNTPGFFGLRQNYPNPFNPKTRINFEIPKKAYAKLEVFDITGKSLEVLVNEEQGPGKHYADFDGTNYPSGVYFCRLVAEDFSRTIKMILLK